MNKSKGLLVKVFGGLAKIAVPEVAKAGLGSYIDRLGRDFAEGVIDAEFLEEVARLLEEGAKTIRGMYGGTGDGYLARALSKGKVQVREVEREGDEEG